MLKKLLVLPLVLLLLCGCTNRKKVEPILNNISFNAEIKYDDNKYVVNASVKDDALNIVVIEPNRIKDLTFVIDKNGATAKFGGVEFVPRISSLPQGAVVNIFYKIINDINNIKTADYCGDNCVVESSVDNIEYNFKFSPSGLPISLNIDEFDVEIIFKKVTIC